MYADQLAGRPLAPSAAKLAFAPLLESISKSIAAGHSVAERMEQFNDRLCNPVPRPVGTDSIKTTSAPKSVEGQLAQVSDELVNLIGRLNDIANRLDTAA